MTTPTTKSVAAAPKQEIGYQQAIGHYQWWLYEAETTPELMWPQSIFVYDQMRRTDAQVGSVLRAVTLPVIRTPWRLDPNGARDEVVQFVADDLGLPIKGKQPKTMPRSRDRFSWTHHLSEALLMLPLGYSYFEQVYRVDDDGKRAHLHKLALRPAKTIQYVDVAEDGGLNWIKQYWVRTGEEPKPIPVDHLVAYVHAREGGNWLGTSILRNCYKNWLLKDRLLRVQAQTIERNGMGIPLFKGPEGATDLSVGLAMAKGWRAGDAAGTAIPFGSDLILRGVEGTLPDAEPAIRYHDEQIARAVLAHFLNLGTQTGSWALGTTFADFFTLSLQTLAQQIADVATQHVIEDLVDINFGEDEPAPIITFDEIGRMQPATADALRSLTMAGIVHPDEVLEESTRQQYGLPPKDPNAPKIPPPLPSMVRENLTGQAPGTLPLHPNAAEAAPAAAPAAPTPDAGGADASAAVAAMRSVAATAADELRGLLEEVRAAAGVVRAVPPPDDEPPTPDGPPPPDPEPTPPPSPVAAAADPELLGEDIDEQADAITAALDEWVDSQLPAEVEAKYNPKELRIPGGEGGGRWTANPIGRAIAHALEDWGKGKGPDDPFTFDGKPIDREPLRKAAVARGITLKRGASRDDIVKALLGGVKDEVVAARTERQRRKGSAKFSINGPNGHKIDVAVYTGTDPNAPTLREVTSANRPGRTITSQPDLAGLEKWATDNGHTDVADWAKSERARAEAKNAPKAAKKAAPRKRTTPEAAPSTDVTKSTHAAPLSGDELQAIAEIHGRAGHSEGGWVRKSDMSPASARHLDGLVEQGWLQKHSGPDGDLYRVDPRSAGTRKGQAESAALVGDVLPAPTAADSTLKLTKLNRGAIIEGHIGEGGTFGNEPTPGSRPVRVVVQRIEPLDQNGQPVKAPILGGVGELGHFQMSGEKPMARIIGHDADTGRRVESDVVSTNSHWSWHMNPETDTSPDIEGEIVQPRQGLPGAPRTHPTDTGGRITEAEAWKRMHGDKPMPTKAPAKAAKKATPKTVEHAPVHGRDLLGDSDGSKLAESLLASTGGVDTPELAHAIAERQGFDGRPEVVSTAEYQRRIDAGQQRLFRGLHNDERLQGRPAGPGDLTARDWQDKFISDAAHFPDGAWGSGIYTTGNFGTALRYGDPMYMTLSPDARVADWATLRPEHEAFLARLDPDSAAYKVFSDQGRYASARGYDAIHIKGSLENETLVLNRTALAVRDPHELQDVSAPKAPAKKAATKAAKAAPKVDRTPLSTADRTHHIVSDPSLTDRQKRFRLKSAGMSPEEVDRLVPTKAAAAKAAKPAAKKATPSAPHPDVPAGGARPKGEGGAAAPITAGRDISTTVDFTTLPPVYDMATNTDTALREIRRQQGFDGLPTVVSQAEFDAAVKRGDVQETWRAEHPSPYSPITPDEMVEQYRSGDFYPGTGINGNGTYVALRQDQAHIYGSTLMRVGLRKDARTISADDLDAEMDRYFATAPEQTAQHRRREQDLLAALQRARSPRARANARRAYREDMYGPDLRSRTLQVQRDPGRFAALRGYDAITIPKDRSPDHHAEIIILNRTATIVQGA